MSTMQRVRGVKPVAALASMLVIAVALAACLPLVTPPDDGAPVDERPSAEAQSDPSDSSAVAPDECISLLGVIDDFTRADDYAAVVELVDQILDCGVDDDLTAGLFFLRAESNMKQGDWQTAIDDYRDALAFGLEAQDAAGARNNICWFLSLAGQADEALPYCEQAVEASPSASYLDSRALAYALLGRYDEAVADFEAALDEWASSENPQIQKIAAQRLEWVESLRAGESPLTPDVLATLQAEDAPALRADLESATDSAATELLMRGRQHHMRGEFDAAHDAYSDAIELDPEYTLAYFYRGMVDLWMEEWENALSDMQRVVLLDPEQAYAHHVVGLMYMRDEDYADAIPALSAAIDLRPDETNFYADRAAAFFSLGEIEDALSDLDTVLAYTPDSAQMLFMRGAAHRALNNRGAAIADLERALELGLPFELAEQARQALRELREGFF